MGEKKDIAWQSLNPQSIKAILIVFSHKQELHISGRNICNTSYYFLIPSGWPIKDSASVPVHRLARARRAEIWGGLHRFYRPSAQNQGAVWSGWTNQCSLQVKQWDSSQQHVTKISPASLGLNCLFFLCGCSAGVGRTGVFITLSIVLERMRYEGAVDIFQTVKMLRTQRPAMVQTEVNAETACCW